MGVVLLSQLNGFQSFQLTLKTKIAYTTAAFTHEIESVGSNWGHVTLLVNRIDFQGFGFLKSDLQLEIAATHRGRSKKISLPGIKAPNWSNVIFLKQMQVLLSTMVQ